MQPYALARFAAIVFTFAFACASAILCLFVLAYAAPVWAARNAEMQACRADFSKLCSGVKLGGGRAAECLKQHEAELAPDCKATMDRGGDCGQQVKKICGAASGAGTLRECIKTHASEFTASCRAATPAQ